MRGSPARHSASNTQDIPRILPREAARVIKLCDSKLKQMQQLLSTERQVVFGEYTAALDDDALRLAIQPDSWGQRMRARLMSDLAPAYCSSEELSVEQIAHCSSIITACLLLELGRRRGHIHIDFPPNPTSQSARFNFCSGESHPIHMIGIEELLSLVSSRGPQLVSLCYFGDEKCREEAEAALRIFADGCTYR